MTEQNQVPATEHLRPCPNCGGTQHLTLRLYGHPGGRIEAWVDCYEGRERGCYKGRDCSVSAGTIEEAANLARIYWNRIERREDVVLGAQIRAIVAYQWKEAIAAHFNPFTGETDQEEARTSRHDGYTCASDFIDEMSNGK